VNFAVFILISILKQKAPLPLLLFTLNLTAVTNPDYRRMLLFTNWNSRHGRCRYFSGFFCL